MRPFLRPALLLCCLLAASSCRDITHVQLGYISDRDECHQRAEYGVGSYTANSNAISSKDRGNMLLQLFCECMKEREWSVAGCKFKDASKIAASPAPQQPAPTVVVVQQAPPAAAPAAVAEPAACPAPPPGKKRAKRRIDGTCPAPEEYSQKELDQLLNQQ